MDQLLTNEKIVKLLIENYYPKNRIKPVTEYFIQEIFENDNN